MIRLVLTLAFLIVTVTRPRARAAEIALVTAPEASSAERIAAAELGAGLQRMFPRDRFVAGTSLPAGGKAILVGTVGSPLVRRQLGAEVPAGPESFVVRRTIEGGRELGVIAGADPRGAMYGVCALLEQLGGGFLRSGDALPPPRSAAFDFDGWQLADRPLVPDRFVFNWHNFLSGCSTWNLEDWRRWTTQSQKMGYNAIMVHAYGNNPMAGFTFDGTPKPDTPEGDAFYRAQVEGLRRAYPHLTTLVVWFRRGGMPWMDVKPADLPAAWQQELAAEFARTPEAEAIIRGQYRQGWELA